MVEIGQKAPDFRASAVRDGDGHVFELFTAVDTHEVTVLLFYPADFVPSCTAELVAVREAGWTEENGLAIVGVSADSLFSHASYADQYDLPLALVSDFHGSVAESYDLLVEEWEGHSHIPARATVVVDSDWTVRAVERVADALDHDQPAPVTRATGAIRDSGVDVAEPTVEYAEWG